jgi:hypothetical protein
MDCKLCDMARACQFNPAYKTLDSDTRNQIPLRRLQEVSSGVVRHIRAWGVAKFMNP